MVLQSCREVDLKKRAGLRRLSSTETSQSYAGRWRSVNSASNTQINTVTCCIGSKNDFEPPWPKSRESQTDPLPNTDGGPPGLAALRAAQRQSIVNRQATSTLALIPAGRAYPTVDPATLPRQGRTRRSRRVRRRAQSLLRCRSGSPKASSPVKNQERTRRTAPRIAPRLGVEIESSWGGFYHQIQHAYGPLPTSL